MNPALIWLIVLSSIVAYYLMGSLTVGLSRRWRPDWIGIYEGYEVSAGFQGIIWPLTLLALFGALINERVQK